MNHNKRS